MNIRTIFKNLRFCKEDILQYKPDAVILVDYPGFNLRIAEWAKQQGIKVIYYISPQVWAWKENRVKKMKQTIDKMIVILPFEKFYFKDKWNWDVEYVGHPLVEVIENYKLTAGSTQLADKPIIALLPGSRKQEILKKLPIMLEVAPQFPAYQFIIAKAPSIDDEFYNELIKSYPNVSWVNNRTYELLSQSTAALVTSGTATLETALFEVPEIVCYKGSAISYQVAKRVIKVKYISLVNLIMDKLVVKELIQDDFTVKNLVYELKNLLENPNRQKQLVADYQQLKNALSFNGDASGNAARIIYDFVSGKTRP
jgi:lipid-A-disaccharide synthase